MIACTRARAHPHPHPHPPTHTLSHTHSHGRYDLAVTDPLALDGKGGVGVGGEGGMGGGDAMDEGSSDSMAAARASMILAKSVDAQTIVAEFHYYHNDFVRCHQVFSGDLCGLCVCVCVLCCLVLSCVVLCCLVFVCMCCHIVTEASDTSKQERSWRRTRLLIRAWPIIFRPSSSSTCPGRSNLRTHCATCSRPMTRLPSSSTSGTVSCETRLPRLVS